MNNRFYITIIFLLTFPAIYSQVKKGNIYPTNKVRVDSAYGIIMYEKMNFALGGDSVRYDKKGYSASGWYEDFYENGIMLHKGYYAEGALKTYQNYYDNGQLERLFKSDYNKANLMIYYRDGKVKADIDYSNGTTIREADYYPNGQMEYVEEYDKNGLFIKNNFFNADGTPVSTFELIEPKKSVYEKKEYHENGKLKETGKMNYNKGAGDYQKEGKWLVYDESGKLNAEQVYSKGELADEKKF